NEAFTLVAAGVDAASPMTATAELKVRPVLESFAATPQAAKPGETITFTWKTRGASEVTISESTFQTLTTVTTPSETDQGSWEWTVPDKLPNGKDPLVGQPLHFTLTVKSVNPALSTSVSLDGFMGEGPAILEFTAPEAVSQDERFTLQWKTLNGNRLQLRANGDLIYEPIIGDSNKVAAGSVELVAPPANTDFELTVWGHGDVRTVQSRAVRVVKPPSITTFNVPVSINNVGDAAAISWTTADAVTAVVRVKNGPSVYATRTLAEAAAGNTSVYPGLSATIVLEAFNEAGDVAREERTITVNTPAVMSAQPGASTPGQSVAVTWDLQGTPLTRLVGDPGQLPLKNNPITDFYELENHVEARKVAFDSPEEGIEKLEVPTGFRYPLPGALSETFYVSVNGFLSFTDSGAQPTNATLTAAGAAVPSLVAPFWDDLKLGAAGEVLYLVEGNFPRRLIVQWNKVEKARSDDALPSELTFQVQLWETGELRFAYKTLVGDGAAGDSASVGWRKDESLAQEFSFDQPLLAAQDELVFLNSGRMTGDYAAVVAQSSALTLVGQLSNNALVVFPAPVNVVKPGSVVINEVMPLGDPTATKGQWVELLNVSDQDVDLTGTFLTSTTTMTSWQLPSGLVLAPDEIIVLGESTVASENGDTPVDLAWSGLTFDTETGDTVQLTAVQPVAEKTWLAADLVAGRSIQHERAIGTDAKPLPCETTRPYSPSGALGTPGAENESCFEYLLSRIPVAFEDIHSTGSPLFVPMENMDSRYAVVDLSSAPFTWFGQPKAVATVSANGWIAFEAIANYYSSNESRPSPTNTPVGALAVFWDDLENKNGLPGANVYVERREASGSTPARWIVQWEDFTHWGTTAPEDTLQFQAKLFDDGVVELHYATMISGYSINYAAGTNATIWIERPTGEAALPVGINKAVISPNTAYRFMPNP
ncbi:MAG: lamin tail domain-containing protein, partial [Myxococcaceae bacterium]